MKQLVQNVRSGHTQLLEVPVPVVGPGEVLISGTLSLVSLGTEGRLVSFSKSGLLGKALLESARIPPLLAKLKTDGFRATLRAVNTKLDTPVPLGYNHVGRVIGLGTDIHDLQLGDRVVSNGPHAEIVCVARNLVCPIPDAVTDRQAAFAVMGAVGLAGIRLLSPTLGETIVVVGLGLVGLLTAELLRINGCRVVGVDLEPSRIRQAQNRGIEVINAGEGTLEGQVRSITKGVGADGVMVTAAAHADHILHQASEICRKRGRIVLIGVVDLKLNRRLFYEKELSFQVSCSYGPGRYDPSYEQQQNDYPLAYVRWTENRNFQAVLALLSTGQLEVESLIADEVPFHDYGRIYAHLNTHKGIAYLLLYSSETSKLVSKVVDHDMRPTRHRQGRIALIGAGQFVRTTLLPTIKGADIKYIVSAKGLSAASLALQYGIDRSTTDYHQVLADAEVGLVWIATRHHLHATLVLESLAAGKHVLVEKPLALSAVELESIARVCVTSSGFLSVGYNRRFAPFALKMKSHLGIVPVQVVITVNAGRVEANSWVYAPDQGGRIVGEVCHFIDLITFLTDSLVKAVCMQGFGNGTGDGSILLNYRNGSTGIVHYFTEGNQDYPKERVEVFAAGTILRLENFRVLRGYGFEHFTKTATIQDKGHRGLYQACLESMRAGGAPPIPLDMVFNTSYASLAALQSLQEKRWVDLDY
ncbi:putative dehydrogenase [Dyadobacter jejuensis]|uniref:Putative dehydrogenase n=1 Tax=Dyadobacter jejuensis TaxID=1082580 RepID=A0A316AR70_9BACT|nr:bi-domain-containing oxidoreductase [Dyadobacter jejuensis]PWJ59931.1 putative dehydrogenase [Dyadobacter jejuensis]